MQHHSVIGWGLVVVGVLLGALQGVEYLWVSAPSTALAFSTLPFVLVAAAIAYTGLTIARRSAYEGYAALIVAWGVGGAVGFVAVFVLATATSPQAGSALLFGAVDAGSAGGLAGLLVGLYDVESRRTLSTVERFAERLDGLNTYGKVLNQSPDIESVSALCVEVVEFVLGGDGGLFVTTDGERISVVDTTLPDVDPEGALGEAVAAVADHEPLETVTDEAGFAGVRNDQPGSTLAVRIPYGDGSAMLFAVYYDVDSPDEELVDPFEILAAHAATALSSVEARAGGSTAEH
ncbi:hypothetical protein [Halohasta salina]|uniref:hypothetical protein n=1 Tax=Halohasta salina TaxID=2961621 RepID=UPI0020A3238D|nr:hypothetical protein [Halohasta salina]